VKILFADDQALFVKLFKDLLPEVEKKTGQKLEVLGIARNGKELVDMYRQHKEAGIDAIFTDIRMPEMDGLSALVIIKKESIYKQKIYLVSSENLTSVETLHREQGGASCDDVSFLKKMEMISKVADRVRNNVTEAGKTNSILSACEKTETDPVRAAAHFGANGYLLKPYDVERLTRLFQHVRGGTGFCDAT
jgi:two-component system response regulator YesN